MEPILTIITAVLLFLLDLVLKPHFWGGVLSVILMLIIGTWITIKAKKGNIKV